MHGVALSQWGDCDDLQDWPLRKDNAKISFRSKFTYIPSKDKGAPDIEIFDTYCMVIQRNALQTDVDEASVAFLNYLIEDAWSFIAAPWQKWKTRFDTMQINNTA